VREIRFSGVATDDLVSTRERLTSQPVVASIKPVGVYSGTTSGLIEVLSQVSATISY